jgi:hypothetical protein
VTLALALDNKNDKYDSAAPLVAITREIAMPSRTLPQTAQTGSPNGGAAVNNPGLGGANQNQPPGANPNQPRNPNNPNSNFPRNSGHF